MVRIIAFVISSVVSVGALRMENAGQSNSGILFCRIPDRKSAAAAMDDLNNLASDRYIINRTIERSKKAADRQKKTRTVRATATRSCR